MARRPQQHDRKGTVVTKGPQAGKARQGATVNAGLQYDDTGSQRRRPGGLRDLAGDDTGVDASLAFLPEHLRVLPADPRDLFQPVTVCVACGDSEHTIRLTGNDVELGAHDVADDVVAALGGGETACLKFRDLYKKGLDTSLEARSGDNRIAVHEKEPTLGDVHILNVDGDTDRFAARLAITARSGRSGAVQCVALQVADHWMQSLGAAPMTGERARVWVNRPDDEPEERDELFWRSGTTAKKRPVAMYGSFGSREHTRLMLNVNEDWYDHVRDHGVLFQGRLSLGINNEGRVVADIDPTSGNLFARLVREGETLPLFDDVLAEAIEKREARADRLEAQVGDRLVIGSFVHWEYNDEFYYREGGSTPYGYFTSPADAQAWEDFSDVAETMFTNQNRPGEYSEYLDSFPKAFQDRPDGDVFDLMNSSVNEAINPASYAHQFAEWNAIGEVRS